MVLLYSIVKTNLQTQYAIPVNETKESFSFKGFSFRHTHNDAVRWRQNAVLKGATASSGEKKYTATYRKIRCATSIS